MIKEEDREELKMAEAPQDQVQMPLYRQKLRRFTGDDNQAKKFIKEAQVNLELQPAPDNVAAGWIMSFLDGQARDKVMSLETRKINTPGKIFNILRHHWGDHRDAQALTAAFFKRQQGLTESVAEYSTALQTLWSRANALEFDTLSERMLNETFVNGLYPPSLSKDMRRFVREDTRDEPRSFDEIVAEAQRWMRQDHVPEVIARQTSAAMPSPSIALEEQVNELKAQFKEHCSTVISALQSHPPKQQPAVGQHSSGQTSRRGPTCWWCQRPGHREAQCRAKQQYQERRGQQRRPTPKQNPNPTQPRAAGPRPGEKGQGNA